MKKLRSIIMRLFSDDLLRHTSILFSGMMVVHVCNMVFQMAVIRALSKEEYALLAAFLGALAIMQRPLGALATGMNRYSSLLRQEGRAGDIKRLLRKWLLLTGGGGLTAGLLMVVFNRQLAGAFHLDRTAPVVIAGAVLPALFCSPVLGGVVRGMQCFKWVSASSVLGALARLGLGAGFVWFAYSACGWAMLGHGMGLYITAGILLAGAVWALRGAKKTALELPHLRFFLLQSFFVQAAYAVLLTADVVMVKHYLPEQTDFAYAATLGRLVLFLPGAIVAAMFPKVAARGAGSWEQFRVFVQSLGLTAAFVGAAVVSCLLFSGLLIRIFGVGDDSSAYVKQMIQMMALVMALNALLNVMVQYLLAQHRFKPALFTVGFAVLYLVAASIFHASAGQIVLVSGLCNGGAFLGTSVWLWRAYKKEHFA